MANNLATAGTRSLALTSNTPEKWLPIETGMSWINSALAYLSEIPFVGVKRSGYGRELSEFGFTDFVNHHLVYEPE